MENRSQNVQKRHGTIPDLPKLPYEATGAQEPKLDRTPWSPIPVGALTLTP